MARGEHTETMGIAAFLRARRAALEPGEAGLPRMPNRRRVPGLRREEVAQLAGISVDYYVRIEQGRAHGISDSVLEALARALRMTEDERSHLRNLAAPRHRHGGTDNLVVRPQIQRLLDSMETVPAFVVGPGLDYLAWNRLGARIAYDMETLPPEERNSPLLVFLHPESRALHPDWDSVAAETVAALRAETGRHPGHPRVEGVLARLLEESPEFRALWEEQEVREKLSGTKRIHHPGAGELTVTYETFRLTLDPDQTLCTYTVDPGSPSETALRRLAGEPVGAGAGRAGAGTGAAG
ncbi:helix-turn-helix transcriptional regulator [Streptomyces sp. NPDC054796]